MHSPALCFSGALGVGLRKLSTIPRQMNYTQHPLSAAFPAMSHEELMTRISGEIPSNSEFIDRVIDSDWFKGLSKSQRAAYAVGWFNFCDVGSNQHKTRITKISKRFSAEQAQIVISGAMA